jgi:hypothetical protein
MSTLPKLPKAPNADEHGEELAVPPPHSDVMQIIYLLEYARRREFKIGPMIQIGDVTLQVADLRQEANAQKAAAVQETSIWQEHGHDETEDA